MCVIAPIAEEFFFRGFVFGALAADADRVAGRDLGTWVAAIITGILFGLAHTGSASAQYLVPLGIPRVRAVPGALANRLAVPVHGAALDQQLARARVNQLHWNAPEIVGLMVGSLLVIGVSDRCRLPGAALRFAGPPQLHRG